MAHEVILVQSSISSKMGSGLRVAILGERQQELLRLLWNEPRLSRWELHERTGLNPNAIGAEAAELLEQGIVRELQTAPVGPGRPRVPLEIDPETRHVVGLGISPGRIEACRLNLCGNLVRDITGYAVHDPDQLIPIGVRALQEMLDEKTLSVGVSATGFIDSEQRTILFSSALPGRNDASLQAFYDVAAPRPIILENNLHAMAARWLLTHQAEAAEDVLLVLLLDGGMAAAVLIEGRPNRGCVTGSNELGHTRFPSADTEICYCGHRGCLERIFSTKYLHHLDLHGTDPAANADRSPASSLMQRAAAYSDADASMARILDYLSVGLSNAANFIRPNRLVIVSELTRHSQFTETLLRSIRERLFHAIAQRIHIDFWDQPAMHSAESAGWLALASLYRTGWSPSTATAIGR